MTYKTKGTCSQMIEFEITDGKVHNVKTKKALDCAEAMRRRMQKAL